MPGSANDMQLPMMAMETYLAQMQAHIAQQAPQLLPVFADYLGEARFGMRLLATDLDTLPAGAVVLEIGAGSHLLSCWLQHLGYRVIAVEPIGGGFSHLDRLREIILDVAAKNGYLPELYALQAETLGLESVADFAFSINVMEHVGNVGTVLQRVHRALKPGACYRFVCPNYIFPYEPHFNMPTLGGRKLTEWVLGHWIFNSRRVVDPRGTWASLNWINVLGVRQACRSLLNCKLEFSSAAWQSQIRRALADTDFQQRRGYLICTLFWTLDRLGLSAFLMRIPLLLLPVMDCRIHRLPEVHS